jgi:hypothetical protein
MTRKSALVPPTGRINRLSLFLSLENANGVYVSRGHSGECGRKNYDHKLDDIFSKRNRASRLGLTLLRLWG